MKEIIKRKVLSNDNQRAEVLLPMIMSSTKLNFWLIEYDKYKCHLGIFLLDSKFQTENTWV